MTIIIMLFWTFILIRQFFSIFWSLKSCGKCKYIYYLKMINCKRIWKKDKMTEICLGKSPFWHRGRRIDWILGVDVLSWVDMQKYVYDSNPERLLALQEHVRYIYNYQNKSSCDKATKSYQHQVCTFIQELKDKIMAALFLYTVRDYCKSHWEPKHSLGLMIKYKSNHSFVSDYQS